MLAWCSSWVVTIRSPLATLARPQLKATRLIASVALRTNTISRSDGAPRKAATLRRAASKREVASSDSS